MKIRFKSAAGPIVLLAVVFGVAIALAADSVEKKGWGANDPYARLYSPKELEKIKAKVVKVMEVVPMPGMSPATAMEVREGNSTIVVHLCPTWFAKPADIGVKPGDAVWHETFRLALLVASFLALMAFGVRLLADARHPWQRVYLPLWGLLALWVVSVLAVALVLTPLPLELINLADVLSRYTLGIPAALLGTWALMTQQRTFREHAMPQFGRDLVWSATALLLYGAIGQLFVRSTDLPPSTVLNSALFLQWFGIPVQLFRGVMAAILTVCMVRAVHPMMHLDWRRKLRQDPAHSSQPMKSLLNLHKERT